MPRDGNSGSGVQVANRTLSLPWRVPFRCEVSPPAILEPSRAAPCFLYVICHTLAMSNPMEKPMDKGKQDAMKALIEKTRAHQAEFMARNPDFRAEQEE